MDWVPIAFDAFKVTALPIAMLFAIKWHYDQAKVGTQSRPTRQAKVTVMFVVALVAVGFVVYCFSMKFGLNLSC